MHYVIGDIHGQYAALQLMLEKIHYRPGEDTLYFVGDYVDWGKDSMKVLLSIIQLQEHSPNVYAVLGNHDLMMLEAIHHPWTMKFPFYFLNDWFLNRGRDTFQQYLSLPDTEKDYIKKWLESLPIDMSFEVAGSRYILAHSVPERRTKHPRPYHFPKRRKKEAVWYNLDKDTLKQENVFHPEGTILIRGHRITDSLNIEYWGDTIINIDCGAKAIGCGESKYKLACLCLETKEEFYVWASEAKPLPYD